MRLPIKILLSKFFAETPRLLKKAARKLQSSFAAKDEATHKNTFVKVFCGDPPPFEKGWAKNFGKASVQKPKAHRSVNIKKIRRQSRIYPASAGFFLYFGKSS